MIRLFDGARSADWRLRDVEIRAAPDDAWLVRAVSRMTGIVEGQAIEYPGRLAECPEGHERRIPSRFDATAVELRCAECRRSYRFEARRRPD